MRACGACPADGRSSIHERSIQRSSSRRWLAGRPRGQHRGEPGAPAGPLRPNPGTPIGELDESDIVPCADDEFLCSEALSLLALIRKAGAMARQA